MEITNISSLDRTSFINQDYKPQDEILLNALEVNNEFGNPDDKIEIHVISPNGDVIESVYDFRNYKINITTQNSSLYNQIELDPKADLESFGYFSGQYDVNYNFYRQLFLSSPSNNFYISEISSDRTEIKISNNNISYNDLGQNYLNYIATRNSRNFYSDFILNFGENDTYIAVNVALDNVNTNVPSLYIKLYEPLPTNLNVKNTLWLVESISEPYSFRVNTDFIAEEIDTTIPLRGPNVNIELNDKVNLTTPYLNLSNLLDNSLTSSYQQLQSWLEEKSIEITVDYTNFNNFVHFSSAEDRLNNFKYKLTQIQSLQADIDNLNNLNPLTGSAYINSNKEILQNKLNTIIKKFDGYEYYLYYESGSKTWPKTNSSKPYINAPTTSSLALTWLGSNIESSTYYGGQILSASLYDNLNKNYIWNNLPEYIKADSQNANLELFTSMLGQHYDYIWTYIKDITDIQVADNRIDFGISKDLVADTLRNFGIKLYTNSRNQDDIYSSLLGINAEGSFLPSTGSYLINNYVTASQYTIPDNDIVKETYKRLYHNLPYLLKTRGTRTGLNALINCFGIPETILKVKEYGGSKKDENLIEQVTPKFNYSLKLNNTASLAIPFQPSYKQYLDTGFDNVYPDTFEFRFKFDNTSSLTQSLLQSQDNRLSVGITPSTSSYASLFFKVSGSGTNFITSSQITLPFYNKDWWNLNITKQSSSLSLFPSSSINQLVSDFQARVIADGGTFESTVCLLSDLNSLVTPNLTQNQYYTITVGNKDSNGIQYLTSSSLFITGELTSSNAVFNSPNTFYLGGTTDYPFSGSIQEFRYWIDSIPISDFKDHILNPRSISFNGVTSSYNNLIFRLPLGSELDNTITASLFSVHPAVTASFTSASITSSKAVLNNYISSSYKTNNETFLVNTPNVGNITEIDEKVRIVSQSLITGSVLTPYISIQKPLNPSYTNDLSIVDISLSPQDSINSDIIAQLGSFNIDEYIGDPRLASSGSYPALNELRDFYFQKYSKSQNVFDLIKLLSYFDNSLFKMIKDFVPAKANLSTGIVIQPHILERNKTARQEPTLEFVQFSGSIETAFITGSNGLDTDLDTTNTITTQYLSGSINVVNTDRRELFTGELGGTEIIVHSQSLENIVYEYNSISISSSQDIINNFSRLPINPVLNNVIGARTSNRYLDIDYSYNPIIPVNFNFLTSSLFLNLRTNAFPFLNSTVQDSNYTLHRHITPRYLGSKNISSTYNVYTPGDLSYGSEAAIDYNNTKFAYFNELTSQSLTFPSRTNINIKYLIDSSSNVIELTEANKNVFDVQNIFNKTKANIALENINQPSKQKRINGLKPIYAGGFRYEPILQNYSLINSTQTSLSFNLEQEIATINPASGSEITASFSGLSIEGFSLQNDITISPSLNQSNSTLSAILDSGINVSVTRTQASNETIYQKITGQIQVNVSVSPDGGQTFSLWSKNSSGPYTFPLPFPLTITQALTQTDGTVVNMWDNVRYITLPAGYIATTYNGGGWVINTIGPKSYAEIQNYSANNGIDYIEVKSNDTAATLNLVNQLNSFGTNPTFNTGSGGPYNIEGDDGLSIIATFQIDGFIELVPGVGVVNGSSVSLPLKSLNGLEGVIRTTFNFAKTSTSPNIRFTQIPSINLGIGGLGGSYILTDAPNLIYTTTIIDNGYNSGSGNDDNWYFERGGNDVNKLTQLTASYDLSTLYSKYISSPIGEVNYFTQTLPTSSINVGYQEINEIFNPKPGDLIRFYNHEADKYPFASDFEKEIIKIIPPQGPIGSGSFGTGSYANRLVIEVLGDDIPNISCINKNSLPGEIGKILNFIIMSKIPDETNIIIIGEKNNGQTSGGIVLPENINNNLKEEAGNIVKNLKSQNLI
jgi:hypothetical protein